MSSFWDSLRETTSSAMDVLARDMNEIVNEVSSTIQGGGGGEEEEMKSRRTLAALLPMLSLPRLIPKNPRMRL